ncbi:Dopey, N-terminal-domain-containing protein, partial [Blyttiomyces helicus]
MADPASADIAEPPDLLTVEDLRKDAKYKRYVQAIEKTLQSFDAVNEWADVIGFLTKLAKIFAAHPRYSIVPRKLVVSKRLAQCLNPALPAGVHQKTLEVYSLIFEAAGSAQLAEDLPLWSYGLFPFLQNAAMSVKPGVLQLYERFYIPLGLRLKPSLKGLILALLPSLEEEGNEFFDRVLGALDQLANGVGQGYFYHCMWLCLITVPHLRHATVNYLVRRMPQVSTAEGLDDSGGVRGLQDIRSLSLLERGMLGSCPFIRFLPSFSALPRLKDVAVILGNDTNLLARALSCTLEDKAALVQRGVLELLVQHFPIKNNLFKGAHMEAVVRSAVCVVLRKDMSLNRRLYAWLLGAADVKALPPTYKAVLVASMREWKAHAIDLSETTKPYKVMISLLDKAEIGQPVLDEIFVDIIWSLKGKCESSPHAAELIQTANMFLEMLDSFMIWKQIYHVIENNALDSCENMQAYEMLEFFLRRFKWTDEETQRVHLPYLFELMTKQLDVRI